MDKTLKYLLLTTLISLAMIILPEKISSGFTLFNNIITVSGYILLIASGVTTGILLLKKMVAHRMLEASGTNDAVWNEERLKADARNAFYKIQYAFENGNTTVLKNFLTSHFLSAVEEMINSRDRRNTMVISAVDVLETYIIGCRDYADDGKDRYVAYIKGTLTESPSDDNDPKPRQFEEMYHFIRNGNEWLLDKINGNITLFNLLFTTSFQEN